MDLTLNNDKIYQNGYIEPGGSITSGNENKFKDQAGQKEHQPAHDSKTINFPLDYYLELERNKTKFTLSTGNEKKANPNSRAQHLIKQINDLTSEAEEKVKACIYDKALKLSPVLSPVSFNESDSGYTEHLVEKKFNEITYQKHKGAGNRLHLQQQDLRVERTNTTRTPRYNKLNYYPVKHGTETFRSAAETVSSSAITPKQANRKQFKTAIDPPKNPNRIQKPSTIFNVNKKQFKEQQSKKIFTSPYCSSDNRVDNTNELKHVKNTSKNDSRCTENKLFASCNHEQIEATISKKQYNDASVNTDPVLARLNTRIINVVSMQEEKSVKINNCANKLYQIQELPNVDIRPNFTKQAGPVIEIKTTKSSLQKNNIAVVECVHGETVAKGTMASNVVYEPGADFASQTVSPPAVHFKNSRDLKLLKVTKDLLGKLNFKDGSNVEKLKRSLTNLVTLLNQISPIHVASLRLTSLDASSASESIDTFFSNIDLVTEIVENEIKKPTGRYCDYPECLIKAVDLLCGNIRSIFVIEETRKRTTKLSGCSALGGDKNMGKKLPDTRCRKSSDKKKSITQRASSASSAGTGHNKEEIEIIANENSKSNNPPDLYIPYRMLIPGGKHKAMELAENSQDIELRFKRLEKVLEINKSLKEEAVPRGLADIDQSHNEEKKSFLLNNDHVLNETFVIKSDSDNDNEGQTKDEKPEPKTNKSDPDYEDDWEMDSSKSYDGSMTMTEIKVTAQVHSSEVPAVFAHSSPRKSSSSEKSSQELNVSNKGSQTESLTHVCSKRSQYSSSLSQRKDISRKEKHHSVKSRTRGELKDVETQHDTEKRDMATATSPCEHLAQSSEGEIVEPIPAALDIASFTVLRMIDPTKNSLVEVRFPEQTENLQSSLTFQKSKNNEEIKFLYNMNKEEKVPGWQGIDKNGSNYNSHLIISGKQELVKPNPSNPIEKQPPKHGVKSDEKSCLEKREELNDFENMTSNFIGFLEKKVTEMVSKFKSSEVTCEKILDQKLTRHSEYKTSQTSLNNFHVNSSRTNLRNDFFYKSASSLFSNQSNEDVSGVRNLLSQRCTPENQEIVPFENLTSPPVGLQLKQSSNLKEVTNSTEHTSNQLQNKESKSNDGIQLFINNNYSEKNSLNGVKNDNDLQNNLISNENTVQMKLVLKEDKENVPDRLHNRLLPLPEDIVSYNSDKKKEKKNKTSSPILQMNFSTEQSEQAENRVSIVKEVSVGQVSVTKSITTTESEPLGLVSPASTAIVEDTLLALMSIEQTFENLDNNDEITVKLAQTPKISSKKEDYVYSQKISAPHIENILSASDSGMSSFTPPNSNAMISSGASWVMKESNILPPGTDCIAQLRRDFSRLLPAPEPIEKHQVITRKFSQAESQFTSDVNIHSLYISGPSYTDKGLNSSVPLPDHSIGKTEEILLHNISQKSPMSGSSNKASGGELLDCSCQTSTPKNTAIQTPYNKPFDNSSQISCQSDASIQTNKNVPSEIASQTSPQSDAVIQTTYNVLLDRSLHTSPQSSAAVQTASNASQISLINHEASEIPNISDDFIQLNYYDPEEMSDGEVGYVYTSNSYSSGEIKPSYDHNDDDSLIGPPTFREVIHESAEHVNDAIHLSKCTQNERTHALVNTNTPAVLIDSHCITQSRQMIPQENTTAVEVFSSSNDSTSTGELKNLFNIEDKIDEALLGKLIDIHIRCSTRFSSESSGIAESAGSIEDRN